MDVPAGFKWPGDMPELPQPEVVIELDQFRVTLRYEDEDWTGVFVIEEKTRDAMGAVAWVEMKEDERPIRFFLAQVFCAIWTSARAR